MFHEALDRPPFARRIAAFKQDDDALTRLFDPGLQLQKLDLQTVLGRLIVLAQHQVLVGIAPFAPVVG